jgi:hypothetical protein
VRASHDQQAQRALLVDLNVYCWRGAGCGSGFAALVTLLDASEFFGVGEHEVHVLIECEHLAGELAAIFEGGAHAVVDLVDISDFFANGSHLSWRRFPVHS